MGGDLMLSLYLSIFCHEKAQEDDFFILLVSY